MLCTHDHFTVDEEGFLYFVGRTDDIVKTRGEKVSTVEVENVLHGLRGVSQVAVVGVPDDLLGEALRAYVVLEQGAALTEEQILRFARSKLENFMVPGRSLKGELPHTERQGPQGAAWPSVGSFRVRPSFWAREGSVCVGNS
jgi:acyl-coenzyme A synthetase/AMP-(fatty) acid ligase